MVIGSFPEMGNHILNHSFSCKSETNNHTENMSQSWLNHFKVRYMDIKAVLWQRLVAPGN